MKKKKVGLIINPVAGLGGSVGLKVSSGLAAEALTRGALPQSGNRAEFSLEKLLSMRELQLTNTLIGVEIVMLRRQPLLVDTGEAELDRHLSGYWQVLRGYNETIVCKVCPG